PDGMRLNQAWFHDPHDRVFYSRHFHRPAPDSQVEWTFPNQYKSVYFDQVLPETLAFMRLIDDTEPDLLVSLHNGETVVANDPQSGRSWAIDRSGQLIDNWSDLIKKDDDQQ
ncbi:hypothetical protein IAE22_33075, partial [Bacillus sp. S34]|nr:hypothetical protein [Bacillus sp. S34]